MQSFSVYFLRNVNCEHVILIRQFYGFYNREIRSNNDGNVVFS